MSLHVQIEDTQGGQSGWLFGRGGEDMSTYSLGCTVAELIIVSYGQGGVLWLELHQVFCPLIHRLKNRTHPVSHQLLGL